ncbi:CheB methylesterase domain-containing protein [Sulfurimonas sp.]|uniref:CheB methylesterase domain-containing protein n=1 Tax=Sulfurimonas sp. TaxID=2022749 RepID=UPI003563885E
MHSVPDKIVLIGASTGGPSQIEKIIKSLPKLENTSFIIAQHMVDGFIPSFAQRLQDKHINIISVVENNNILKKAHIYLCTGFTHIEKQNSELVFKNKACDHNSYNPDIDTLFNSFVSLAKDIKILCVILTGIGEDGVSSSKELSLNGARCITENESSAIVDGMPARARAIVPNIEVYDIDEIAKIIYEFCE